MEAIQRVVGRIDRFQRRHTFLGFPFAVVKKFGEDRAGQLAALIAYYGFFSLFPLLLVLVSVLGLVLAGNPDLQERILDSALAQFPIIGDQIRDNVGSLKASGIAFVVGIVGALWAGLGVIRTAQFAMNSVWDVPLRDRPSFLAKVLRSLVILGVLALFVIAAATLASVVGAAGPAPPVMVLSILGSLSLNLVVFVLFFRVLTVRELSTRDVLPGAIVASVAWFGLQSLGSYIVSTRLQNASQVYGFFAVVIGLLAWIYLGAQITLLASEINVVLRRKLWPRGLVKEDLTEEDRRALERLAKVEERIPDQRVHVEFLDGGETRSPTGGGEAAERAATGAADAGPPAGPS
ncbi:MAG: YihY/virulence factor BrkB family protein [Actinobacteria bacterium]|nr:YihY/virulence factor BrkB family protein [Actinomycetota bacterium]